MANFIFNIAKGRWAEFYDRVKNNDPANSAFVLIPIEASGVESDATLIDYDTVQALLAASNNEQSTMGRKTLTDSDLATIPAPDDANDRNERSLPNVTWTAAAGNAISDLLLAFDSDTTGGTDANLVPVGFYDFAVTPNGSNLTMTGSTFGRAS